MSAEPISETGTQSRPRLAVVHTPTATVSTLGFVAIIAVLIAAGLAGVMVVSTSVGQQSRDLTGLRRQATELGYTSASLESQLQSVSSANALALRATELGMAPNPYPAFINLADGSVTGVPEAVKGDEMPFLTGAVPVPALTQKPIPVPEPATTKPPSDLSAAGSTEQEQP